MLLQHQSVVISFSRIRATFGSSGFGIAAPVLPQSETHSLLAFTLILHHAHSVVFLKLSILIRPSVPYTTLHKCLGFDLGLTLHAVKYFIDFCVSRPLVSDVAGGHAQSGSSSQDQSQDHTSHTASSVTTMSQNAGELNGVPADGRSQEYWAGIVR